MPIANLRSSVIRAIAYDEHKQFLDVTLQDFRTYRYFQVPMTIFLNFRKAFSAGKFYNSRVKNHYRSIRIR